jgi:hypothetical protein
MTFYRFTRKLTVVAIFWLASVTPAFARNQPIASYDDTPLLKQRFLMAYKAAKMPENYDHIDSLIEILRFIEKDFALNMRSEEMIRSITETQPRFKAMYEPGAIKGIRYYQPLEKAAQKKKSGGSSSNLLGEALGLSSVCLASEADYNRRYVEYLEKHRWPRKLAPVRYAIYLRMQKRDCLGERDFLSQTKALVPGVREAMLGANLEAGDAGSYAYLLIASKRFEEIPESLLTRFLQAQQPNGAWLSNLVGDRAVAAAQGAYIIASMLARRNVHITEMELFSALGKEQPPLPRPVKF